MYEGGIVQLGGERERERDIENLYVCVCVCLCVRVFMCKYVCVRERLII